jgi:hypothetical protein
MARPPTQIPNQTSNETLGVILGAVKDDVTELGVKVDKLSEAVGTLSRIEQRQIGIVDEMARGAIIHKEFDTRLGLIEVVMPGLIEVRRWVMAGMVAGVGMMFVAVASLVLYPRPPAYVVMSPQNVASPATSTQHLDVPLPLTGAGN